MVTKAQSKREIGRLVKKLDNLSGPEFKRYDEANTKKDFIEPLFRALSWAIDDRREVTAEDKVSRGRVDYAFRIEGIPKFLLEAKPLKADLDNPEYAWQAINYAWTKGVTWAVLTDFEGLKVYNAQWKGPSLLYNRFIDIPHTEYLERFDELWLLSRESFEKGLLDIQAEKVGKKAKREAVGKELFDDLIVWRHRLYRQLRGWNKAYSPAQIDEAVQRILDRLIFIRTAEDRELEERLLLPAVREWRENGRRKELDKALVRIFRQFDERYDSELFEAGHFCEDLACDSNTHALIIEGLYGMRDEVPTYNFDAIDVDVLGGIYEQYLSYRQGLPEEVEEAKRRRRKKRGIYYTPKFVVEYVVENTVGRLLQERSHDEIRKLRILDPACGSGSFLIEAFDRLDRYHQEARGTAQRSDAKAAQEDFLERLRILRDNIYGVDLDPQAVEIARLNLLLKTLYQRALLPKLENNIRCGNSLISGLPIELSQYFGPDWEAKRPFNWEEEFPKIMKEGGFDVVMGNPPYLGFHGFKDEKLFYRDHFQSATGRFDLYIPFIEQGIRLLQDGGLFGYICPTAFMKRQHGKALRRLLKDTCQIEEIADFGHSPVFGDALNYTCILIMRKGKAESHFLRYYPDGLESESYLVNQDSLSSTGWTFISPEERKLVERIEHAPSYELGELTEGIFEGIVTGQNSVFVLSKEEAKGHRLERELVHPALQGRQIQRYHLEDPANLLLYPYRRVDRKAEVIPEAELKSKYPRAYQYLESAREDLSGRSYFDDSGKVWYELWNERSFANQAVSKIVVRELAPSAKFALAAKDQFYLDTVVGIIPKDRSRQTMLYILGLLNSRLLEHYYKKITVPKAGGFYIYKTMFLRRLPIRRIDFDNSQDVKMHDDLVAMVERMLDLHKRLKDAKGEEERNLERQIARIDRKIDNLVYGLYGLTEEEMAIVEGE